MSGWNKAGYLWLGTVIIGSAATIFNSWGSPRDQVELLSFISASLPNILVIIFGSIAWWRKQWRGPHPVAFLYATALCGLCIGVLLTTIAISIEGVVSNGGDADCPWPALCAAITGLHISTTFLMLGLGIILPWWLLLVPLLILLAMFCKFVRAHRPASNLSMAITIFLFSVYYFIASSIGLALGMA